MAVVGEITAFDRVELIEPADDAPVGARGGVLELRAGDTAMVEITMPKLDPAARIVFVPIAKLRRVGTATVADLLARSRAILAELREHEVIRSGNAPAGDYAEWLVQRATQGELAPKSEKSWDVLAPRPERPDQPQRLQVKARLVTNPPSRGQRQLSPFRSWKFDAAVVVLFDDAFRVWRAVHLPIDVVRTAARPDKHVNADRVVATDELLDRGDDWTDRLRTVADEEG